ncbi:MULTISPECIES: hypothetical protein [Sporosarcina]|uniref:hypothetical protein n=1 Tax=Sporosarcina TaxID=1569 RepID=UPI001181B4FF|nr:MULTISPECIES: hypothetical protein [Sporosarcina]WJY27414.1 hypothetical protein QWT68_15455 [Sporosarcina sp. 0.2-SM1T-5]
MAELITWLMVLIGPAVQLSGWPVELIGSALELIGSSPEWSAQRCHSLNRKCGAAAEPTIQSWF